MSYDSVGKSKNVSESEVSLFSIKKSMLIVYSQAIALDSKWIEAIKLKDREWTFSVPEYAPDSRLKGMLRLHNGWLGRNAHQINSCTYLQHFD